MPVGAGCYRILVVEEDVTFGRVLHAALEAHGYLVRLATGAATALELLSDASYDVVVADQRLGARCGRELLREVGRSSPAPARILMTTSARVSPADVVSSGDAEIILPKPFELGALLEVIDASVIIHSSRSRA